jgi:hypothetical protein
MKPLLRYLLLAFFVLLLGAQLLATQPRVTWETVQHSPADTSRVMMLLDLSHFYVCKLGDKAQDLDSAVLLARQAVALSQSWAITRGRARGTCCWQKPCGRKGPCSRGSNKQSRPWPLPKNTGTSI